ncbi:MAG: hypothetical protein GY842_25900 [bacterium]|nr:hypothetical protein [bacterium]
MSTTPQHSSAIRLAVRRNAIWAAGAAAIMLYYGLYVGLGSEPPPDWPARLRAGSWLALYTLEIGGVLMLLSTILSVVGIRPALLFDALASVAIGLGLGVSGALRIAGAEFSPLLFILFGAVFIHSGYRNWSEYNDLAALEVPDEAAETPAPASPES